MSADDFPDSARLFPRAEVDAARARVAAKRADAAIATQHAQLADRALLGLAELHAYIFSEDWPSPSQQCAALHDLLNRLGMVVP